jgi:hypothetical protein
VRWCPREKCAKERIFHAEGREDEEVFKTKKKERVCRSKGLKERSEGGGNYFRLSDDGFFGGAQNLKFDQTWGGGEIANHNGGGWGVQRGGSDKKPG